LERLFCFLEFSVDNPQKWNINSMNAGKNGPQSRRITPYAALRLEPHDSAEHGLAALS
jgi:hypothetical protein